MLQIIIVKEKDPDKIYISEIREYGEADSYAVFDKEANRIDLSYLRDHIDETIMVTHFIRENGCTRLDYESEKTLTKVDTNTDGLDYIEYH